MDKNKVIDLIVELIREFDVEEEFLARMNAKQKVPVSAKPPEGPELPSINDRLKEIERKANEEKYVQKRNKPYWMDNRMSSNDWNAMQLWANDCTLEIDQDEAEYECYKDGND